MKRVSVFCLHCRSIFFRTPLPSFLVTSCVKMRETGCKGWRHEVHPMQNREWPLWHWLRIEEGHAQHASDRNFRINLYHEIKLVDCTTNAERMQLTTESALCTASSQQLFDITWFIFYVEESSSHWFDNECIWGKNIVVSAQTLLKYLHWAPGLPATLRHQEQPWRALDRWQVDHQAKKTPPDTLKSEKCVHTWKAENFLKKHSGTDWTWTSLAKFKVIQLERRKKRMQWQHNIFKAWLNWLGCQWVGPQLHALCGMYRKLAWHQNDPYLSFCWSVR